MLIVSADKKTTKNTGKWKDYWSQKTQICMILANCEVKETTSRTGRLQKRLSEQDGHENVFFNWTINACRYLKLWREKRL